MTRWLQLLYAVLALARMRSLVFPVLFLLIFRILRG
jgi:hypothetical protein